MVTRFLLVVCAIGWATAAAWGQTVMGETAILSALPTAAGTSCVAVDNNGVISKTGSACATVTSVGLSAPAELSVGGSPVTTSGTLALTWANAAATSVFQRGSGSGVPSFSTSLSLGGTLTITGASALNGGITVDTTAFTVADSTGNTGIGGTLNVTGATLLSSTLDVRGAVSDGGGVLQLADDVTVADTGYLSRSTYASQTTGWRIGADGGADFRYLFSDELNVKNFIADLEQALAGGQIIAKSVAMVETDYTCPAAVGNSNTLRVRDLPSMPGAPVFEVNDWVVLRTFSRSAGTLSVAECVGKVSSYTNEVGGTQTWIFDRGGSIAGCGGTWTTGTIAADSLAIDYGTSGNGYHEINAADGAYAVNSPYGQIVTWTTCPVAANRVRQVKWGQLNGTYGYATSTFGFAAGTEAGSNVTVDAANGIRMRNGTTVLGQWSGSTLTLGQPLTSNNTGQIVIDSDSVDVNWRNNSGSTSTVFKVDNSSGVARIIANGWSLGSTLLAGSVDGNRTISVSGSGSTLTLYANGAGAEVVVNVAGGSTGLRPHQDNLVPLGLSTYNWSAVYATRYYSGSTAGVVSGTCSAVTVTGGIVTGCTP